MKVNSSIEKPSVLTVAPEIYALLDPYHRALAEVLQERGEVRILATQERSA